MKAGQLLENLHINCYAHTLNLAAQKCLAVKRVEAILTKIRRIVAFFHRSNIAAALLRTNAKSLSLPQHKLIVDVRTRWNSAYDMIARFLEMQVAVFATLRSKELGREKDTDMKTFTDDDFSLSEEVVQLMKPLKDITTMMCTEKNPTLSIILPLHSKLVNQLLCPKTDDKPTIRDMKNAMRKDLKERYSHIEPVLRLVTSLDPRFKQLRFLGETEKSSVYSQMVSEVCRVQNMIKVKVESQDTCEAADDDVIVDYPPPLPSVPGLQNYESASPVKTKIKLEDSPPTPSSVTQ
jgi:hypothetical protein